MQHYWALTQNQFQNHILSQQQSHNNIQIPWQMYVQNPQSHVQMQQPYMQNQQVSITHTQGDLTQNSMQTSQNADQGWHISNQQSL